VRKSPRLLLTIAALVPYWRLLTFSVVFITDDYFASDIFNGELPGRILVAAMAASRPAAGVDEPGVLRISARRIAR